MVLSFEICSGSQEQRHHSRKCRGSIKGSPSRLKSSEVRTVIDQISDSPHPELQQVHQLPTTQWPLFHAHFDRLSVGVSFPSEHKLTQ
jgi:hypothetical protein